MLSNLPGADRLPTLVGAPRSAAMFARAGQLPAPVLADLVGISTGKATAWAKFAVRD